MPFANLKVPAGTLSPEQKQVLVEKVTDLVFESYPASSFEIRIRKITRELPSAAWVGAAVLAAGALIALLVPGRRRERAQVGEPALAAS